VGVTLVLLMAAGLCLQSFMHVARLELGFDPANVLTFGIDNLDAVRYPTRVQQNDAIEQVLSRIERLPQVRSASAVLLPPFTLGSIGMDSGFVLEGQPDSPETYSRNPMLNWEAVTPGYFRTMGIRLLRGREFDARDTDTAPLVVIVSEAMASRVWPGENPIGKRLRAGAAVDSAEPRWQTVVGVVATARYREIETPRLDLYVPLRQSPDVMEAFVVKTTIDPLAVAPAIGAEIVGFDRALRMDDVTTMDAIVRKVRGPWQLNMWVFGLFAVAALGLAMIGLFGTVAYAATQRRRELGIRLALGATPRGIAGLMVRQGLGPTGIGVALGVPLGLVTTRLLSDLLFGVGAADPGTGAAVIALLLGAAAVASYVPARRAAATDPAVVLRSE
jgi:predicted permease